MTREYIKGVLPWLLLGPLTGLLAEGLVRNLRAREMPLAWLYGVALLITTDDLYAFGGQILIAINGLRPGLL